jgi:hypothetical protein
MADTGAGTWGESVARLRTRDSVGMARGLVAGGSRLTARTRARDGAPCGVAPGSIRPWLAGIGDGPTDPSP